MFMTKWSKVIFSKCVQGYAETSAWFVHVMSQTVTVLVIEIWISFFKPVRNTVPINNYPDDDIVTWSSNFYFSFEENSHHFRKLNLFILKCLHAWQLCSAKNNKSYMYDSFFRHSLLCIYMLLWHESSSSSKIFRMY